METFADFSTSGIAYVLLLFIRTTGMVVSSPIFGRQNIPAIVKVSFSLALAYFFYKSVPQIAPVECESVITYVSFCAKELLLGLIMGYVLTLFFAVSFSAGQLIDMQVGFGMANVYDPQSNTSIPLLGNMLNVMMMLIFFVGDGHKRLIALMYVTLWRIPIGTVTPVATIGLSILEMFCTSFVLALRMALPIVASGLLGEAILGLIIRTVPQMNVFAIGMPLKVLLGFVVLLGVLPIMGQLTNTVFEEMFMSIESVFADIAAAGGT